MPNPNLDALGNQIIAYDVAIISILQVLTRLDPGIGQVLVDAMRQNNKRVPDSFHGVRETVEKYVVEVEKQIAQQAG